MTFMKSQLTNVKITPLVSIRLVQFFCSILLTHKSFSFPDEATSVLPPSPHNHKGYIDRIQQDEYASFPTFNAAVVTDDEQHGYSDCEESDVPQEWIPFNSERFYNAH
jgi:hypothetical protein